MKKPQKIRIEIDPEYGDIATGEIWTALKNNYDLWNSVKPISEFPGDPIQAVEVRFFASETKAEEIERYLQTAYQFIEE